MFSYLCAALVFVAVCSTAQVQGPCGSSIAKHGPRSTICHQRNAYCKMDTSCDSFIKCTEFVAEEMSCPHGMHYNPEATWPSYPCGHPIDVPCVGSGSAHSAQPSPDCPQPNGYFPSPFATSDNCGHYRVCVAGRAFDMNCSVGLAFNPDTSSCDWPHLVASCNPDQFLGFSCPTDADGMPLDDANYQYLGNNTYFFACEKGHARLLSCDSGLAFDPASGSCVDADYGNCNPTSGHCADANYGNCNPTSGRCADANYGNCNPTSGRCADADYGNCNPTSGHYDYGNC